MPADPIIRTYPGPALPNPRSLGGEACANGKAIMWNGPQSVDNGGYEVLELDTADILCDVGFDADSHGLRVTNPGDYIVIANVRWEASDYGGGGGRQVRVIRDTGFGSQVIAETIIPGLAAYQGFYEQPVQAVGFAALGANELIQVYVSQRNTGGVPLQIRNDAMFEDDNSTSLSIIRKCACGVPHPTFISG